MIKDGSRNVKDPNGTSLNGVKQDTVLGAVDLKQNCKCDTLITGGTEWAHGGTLGNDRKSHENGYKLDFQINDQLSNYIQNNFTSIGNRGDGAPGYQIQQVMGIGMKTLIHTLVTGMCCSIKIISLLINNYYEENN